MNNQIAKYIEKLERELLQPEVRKSAKRISEILADDFVEFGMEGKKFTKKDIVKLLPKSKSEKNEKYKATSFRAKAIAQDTILLTYRASIGLYVAHSGKSAAMIGKWFFIKEQYKSDSFQARTNQ